MDVATQILWVAPERTDLLSGGSLSSNLWPPHRIPSLHVKVLPQDLHSLNLLSWCQWKVLIFTDSFQAGAMFGRMSTRGSRQICLSQCLKSYESEHSVSRENFAEISRDFLCIFLGKPRKIPKTATACLSFLILLRRMPLPKDCPNPTKHEGGRGCGKHRSSWSQPPECAKATLEQTPLAVNCAGRTDFRGGGWSWTCTKGRQKRVSLICSDLFWNNLEESGTNRNKSGYSRNQAV